MRKFFVILAFLAFTQNVNADYAPIDIQIAEGEEYQIDNIIAAQVVNQTSWDGQYILTGGIARVYIDFLPRDGYPSENSRNFYPLYVDQKQNGSWWLYDSLSTQKYVIPFNSPWDAYQWLISNEGQQFCKSMFIISDDEDGNGEYLSLGDFLLVGYSNTSSQSPSQDTQKYNLENIALANNRNRFLTSSDLLEYAQVPINGVRITITNSVGQTTTQFDTNIVVKLDQILQKVTRIQNDTSTMVNELMFLLNAFGYDGTSGSTTGSLAEFLGQWRTADGIWQGEIFDVITNLASQSDYTDWWKMLEGFRGSTNFESIVKFGNQYSYNYPNSVSDGFLARQQMRTLLGVEYSDAYRNFLKGLYDNVLRFDTSWLTLLASAFDREYYYNMGVDWQDFHRKTNIVNAVSLCRDWLNLSTNDLASLPYWLNQQDYSLVGGTNSLTRFDVITNQYAHIGLTGSGQQANSTENWNYFKRLEMLLAALVYKQTDYEGKIDPHEIGNNASVSSSVATGEDQINTSLSAVKDALTLSTIGNAKNNIVSLFQTATSAFDVNGSKRVINVMETDVATGNESAGVTVNVDFTQGELGDFADFVHHLFGFAWGFGSLFIFWRVCKFCWDMGYKVVKFHYSLCRKFLGI